MKMKIRMPVLMSMFYGGFLGVDALLLIANGMGSYVFFYLFSAPLSLLGCPFSINLVEMFFGELSDYTWMLLGKLVLILTPCLWAVAGILATISNKAKRQIWLAAFLLIHYISAIITLVATDLYSNWEQFHEQWGIYPYRLIIVSSLTFYLLGQIWFWLQLLRPRSLETKEQSLMFKMQK